MGFGFFTDTLKLFCPGCIPAEEMQLVMKHVPGCSAADVDEMIEAIDRQDDYTIHDMLIINAFSTGTAMVGSVSLSSA